MPKSLRGVPIFRELTELAYLWNEPHRIDGQKLAAAIGEVPRTPFETAIAAALDDLGLIGRRGRGSRRAGPMEDASSSDRVTPA